MSAFKASFKNSGRYRTTVWKLHMQQKLAIKIAKTGREVKMCFQGTDKF